MADRSLTRSLPLRPDFDPSAGVEERFVLLEERVLALEEQVTALEEWKAEATITIADHESRIQALENP